jgi:hypothetical protein
LRGDGRVGSAATVSIYNKRKQTTPDGWE